jgi:hypothetical protein
LLLLLASGCKLEPNLLAPPPERLSAAPADPAPVLPPTIVDLPLLIDLAAAVALMEDAIPQRLGNVDTRISIPDNRRGAYAFELRRGPLEVAVRGEVFEIGATISYRGRGWYNPPIGPEVGGSCGISGPAPRARLVISVRPELTSDWRLVAKPRLTRLTPLTGTERDQCEVSFLNIDVTGRVLAAARDAVGSSLPGLAARLRAIDVKGEVERIWKEIQQPIQLADSVWLMLRPEGVRLGPLSGSRDMVGGTLGIRARPTIETGPRPDAASRLLPPLEAAGEETGLNLLIEGRIGYDLIGASLTERLKGTTISVPGGTLEIREMGVFGVGGGRLALGVRFGGTASGEMYFVGTPAYDVAAGRITVPDLDYDASTAPLLVKGLAWLRADEIRSFLRARATFPSADAMDQLSTLALNGMNRELVPGVLLSTEFESTSIIRMVPRVDELLVQAHASGHMVLHVTDAFFTRLEQTGPDSTLAGSGSR